MSEDCAKMPSVVGLKSGNGTSSGIRKSPDFSYGELQTVVCSTAPIDGLAVQSEDTPSDRGDRDPSCVSVSAMTACVITVVCASIFLGRDYIKYVLMSLENSSIALNFIVFALLFVAVAFPVTWGYILLNVAAGYMYGVFGGLTMVLLCAVFGILVAHVVIRRFLQNFVRSQLLSASMRSVIGVVDSEHGFKAIALARLTPIPFGLQNALFAMSNISVQRYIAASVTGMLPCQGMYAYVGSTLRSMEEVVSSSSKSTTAYVFFIGQLLMVGALMAFIIRKARVEFDNTIKQVESCTPASSPSKPFCECLGV